MIDINKALQFILAATYGKDVRQAIHDAISQINDNANESLDLSQIKFGNAVTSPTSPIGDYIENTVYFNVETGKIWKLEGGSWSVQGGLRAIVSNGKTKTEGKVDTYTIGYNDGTSFEFTVTNGEQGTSISNIVKVSSVDGVDHYDIELSNGSKTPNGFDIVNGKDGISITNITEASQIGNVRNYDVNLSDGTKTPNGFSVRDGISSFLYVRYSAQFDGTGMVTTPSATTPYIGICVTSQTSAPTDPSVYSWVKFIGESGKGTGDMLKTDFATLFPKTVDRAAALYDGTKERTADQFMAKDDYASSEDGIVKAAVEIVDVVHHKIADTEVLAKFTEDAEGLKYNGEKVGGEVDIDDVTIKEDADGKLKVADEITTKLAKVSSISGINILRNTFWLENSNGQTIYDNTTGGWTDCFDDWKIYRCKVEKVPQGVKYTSNDAWGFFGNTVTGMLLENIKGKTITASARINSVISGRVRFAIYVNDNYAKASPLIDTSGIISTTFEIPTNATSVQFVIQGETDSSVAIIECVKVEFGNFSTIDNDEAVTTFGKTPYELTNEIEDIEERGFYSKNLLPKFENIEVPSGFTVIKNADGTYVVTGNATADSYIILSRNHYLEGGKKYRLTGCPNIEKHTLYIYSASSSGAMFDSGSGANAEIPTSGEYNIVISINNGGVANGSVFKPMLVDASKYPNVTYDDFVPYAKSNIELTEEIANISGGGIQYSTQEIDTGDKWIDGKPIYAKVYENIGVVSKSATINTGSIGVDTIVDATGIVVYSTGTKSPIMYNANDSSYYSAWYQEASKNLTVQTTATKVEWALVKYTKL